MPRHLAVDVPCMLQGVRRKQRKTKWFRCRVQAAVEIPDADALQAPEALVMTYQRWAKSGRRQKETVRMTSAGHAGALWRTVPGPHGGNATFADLQAAPAYWRQSPFKSEAALPPHAEMLVAMREVYKDTSEWAHARASRTAADLLVGGETVYRRDIEPVWLVIPGDDIKVDFERTFPGQAASGIPFPLLEREKAEQVAREIAKAESLKFKTSGMQVETADPSFLSATIESTFGRMMSLAFYAARKSIRRDCRGTIPSDIETRLEVFAEISKSGDDILAAAEILDGLQMTALNLSYSEPTDYDSKPRLRCGGWRRSVELARSFGVMKDVAVPPPAESTELDPEDDEAIAALGL